MTTGHASESHACRLGIDRHRVVRDVAGVAVVTGAAGFIGSHLVDRLLSDGFEVRALDSYDPWYEPGRKRRNLSAAAGNPRLHHLEVDLLTLDPTDLSQALDGADVVYHLAGRPGVQDSWGPGFESGCAQNVLLTQRLLDAALRADVGRVVLASSSSVYGSCTEHEPKSVRPISPYGVSKAAAEQLAHVYRRQGLPIVCLRYFTVFGPRQRPDMAFHRLFAAALGGPAFPRRGSGEQRREFTFVSDVVAATVAAGLAPIEVIAGRTFDVGGGCVTSLRNVIDRIGFVAGRRPEVSVEQACPGDPAMTSAELEPIADALGWRPEVSLDEGLVTQWRWQRDEFHHLVVGEARASGELESGVAAVG